nr:MAG TPA: hypothetical protein [Caudoviricetes sp.]
MTLFFAKFSENFFALPYRSNPCVDQGIDHSGHCLSNLKGVFPGKIDFSGMRMFVSGNPASFANSLEGRRYSYCLDLLVKLVGLFEALNVFVLSVPIHNSFKADSQKGTCRTRGKTNDGLSFVKNFFGIFGHIRSRENSTSERKCKLSVLPVAESFATQTAGDETTRMVLDVRTAATVKNVPRNSEIVESFACNSIERRHITNFSVSTVHNRTNNENSLSSAVRAYVGAWHD